MRIDSINKIKTSLDKCIAKYPFSQNCQTKIASPYKKPLKIKLKKNTPNVERIRDQVLGFFHKKTIMPDNIRVELKNGLKLFPDIAELHAVHAILMFVDSQTGSEHDRMTGLYSAIIKMSRAIYHGAESILYVHFLRLIYINYLNGLSKVSKKSLNRAQYYRIHPEIEQRWKRIKTEQSALDRLLLSLKEDKNIQSMFEMSMNSGIVFVVFSDPEKKKIYKALQESQQKKLTFNKIQYPAIQAVEIITRFLTFYTKIPNLRTKIEVCIKTMENEPSRDILLFAYRVKAAWYLNELKNAFNVDLVNKVYALSKKTIVDYLEHAQFPHHCEITPIRIFADVLCNYAEHFINELGMNRFTGELKYALVHLNRVLSLSMIKGIMKLVQDHQRSIQGVASQFGIDIKVEELEV